MISGGVPEMTPAMARALELLRRVGKVTETRAREEGFAVRTFDRLVEAGCAVVETRPRVNAPFKVFFLAERD